MHTYSRRACVLLLMVAALVLAGCGDNADQSQKTRTQAPNQSSNASAGRSQIPVAQLPDFSALVKKVSPAVVNISAMSQGDQSRQTAGSGNDHSMPNGPLGEWLKRFFQDHPGGEGQMPLPQAPDSGPHVSLGSGFIISSDGYILTNRHVIAGAGQIVVKLNDRRQLVAKVVGQDKYSDIAVLKVDAKQLPTVKIGDPSDLPVGAWVLAIGSPFGFETSVTAGIVSAKQRSLADDQYVPFLQTDVAINPGNSGGPLFNLAGQVVGINSQIYSQTGGYQGVSFAIPIDVAMNVARQLREKGSVTRGWLGVQIQDVDRELAKSFKLSRPEGALVAQVIGNSPAAAAGLKDGDVILAFDGHAVDSAAALPPLVGAVAPGDTAKLEIMRDGQKKEIDVTIKALPKNALAMGMQPNGSGGGARPTPYGLTLESLSTKERHALGLNQGGVKVTNVAPGAGADAGLQTDDVILAVGAEHVEDARTLVKALHDADGPVALLVLRNGARLYLPMKPNDK